MSDISPFWMVYGMGQGAPTVKHERYELAATEARRLARHNPGIRFVVLQAVRGFEKVDVTEMPVSGVDLDVEIPF